MNQKTHLGCYGIITNGGTIALIRKGRGPYLGLLDLPGGSLEFGEHPDQTIAREIHEELHVDVVDQQFLSCYSALFPFTDRGEPWTLHHLGLIYRCKVASLALLATGDGHDSTGADWYPLDQLPADTVTPFVSQALTYLTKP